MHFSVEKSGKEVGSGQRFSHLKCIEFITYSQTTAAIPPAPPIATLAPYLFPGGEGSRFPMPLRCFDPPPPFSPHFTLSTRRGIRRWWNAISNSNTEGMKSRGYTTFHYLSSISHRIVFYRPLLRIFPFSPSSVFPFALFDQSRKNFWRFKFKFDKIFTPFTFSVNWYFWKCD